jgi:hypothetical protein
MATTWTKLPKPAPLVNTGGSPIGLLLALTYARTTGTGWTKVTKAAGTSWTKLTKPTGTSWTKLPKAT